MSNDWLMALLGSVVWTEWINGCKTRWIIQKSTAKTECAALLEVLASPSEVKTVIVLKNITLPHQLNNCLLWSKCLNAIKGLHGSCFKFPGREGGDTDVDRNCDYTPPTRDNPRHYPGVGAVAHLVTTGGLCEATDTHCTSLAQIFRIFHEGSQGLLLWYQSRNLSKC